MHQISTNTFRYTMCSAPNVYMFVYTLIGAQIVPLSIDTFTATLHLRHVERSEVQDTAATHAYVMADLLGHLLDLFMNIQ